MSVTLRYHHLCQMWRRIISDSWPQWLCDDDGGVCLESPEWRLLISSLSLSVLPFTKLSATYQMCWHGYFSLAVSSSSFPVPTESYKAFPHTSCGAGSLIMIPWKSENTFRWCDRLLLFFLFKMSSFSQPRKTITRSSIAALRLSLYAIFWVFMYVFLFKT